MHHVRRLGQAGREGGREGRAGWRRMSESVCVKGVVVVVTQVFTSYIPLTTTSCPTAMFFTQYTNSYSYPNHIARPSRTFIFIFLLLLLFFRETCLCVGEIITVGLCFIPLPIVR